LIVFGMYLGKFLRPHSLFGVAEANQVTSQLEIH